MPTNSTENVGYSTQRGILAQASRLTLVNLAPRTAMPRLNGEIAVYRTYVRRDIAHEDAKKKQASSKQQQKQHEHDNDQVNNRQDRSGNKAAAATAAQQQQQQFKLFTTAHTAAAAAAAAQQARWGKEQSANGGWH